MPSRLLRIVKSKIFIIAAVLLAAYALAGFFLVPYLVAHYVPGYAEQQLKRHASIGDVRCNPFLLQFEANDFDLKEADGRPLGGFKRLFLDFELESLWRWAWTFKEIRLERPSVLLDIAPDGRVNLAALADSLSTSKPPPESARSAPRLLLRRVVLQDGHFAVADRASRTPGEATLQPINLELENVSTLNDQRAPYLLTAQLAGGGHFAWDGEISLEPLHSAGKFELTGLTPAALWSLVQSRFELMEPEGTLDAQAGYELAHTDQGMRLLLKDLGVTAKGITLAQPGAAEPMLRLDALRLLEGRLDLASREAAFGALEIGPGQLRIDVDERGAINWQKLTRGAPAPAAQKTSAAPGAPWKLSLSALRIADLGLHYQDASRGAPIRLDIGKLALDLALALETQPAGAVGTLSDGKLTLSDIALAERDNAAPLIALQTLEASNVRIDLAARDVEAGRLALEGGSIHAERDPDGRIRLLDSLRPAPDASQQKRAAPKSGAPAGAKPWSLALDAAELQNVALAAVDHSMEPAAAVNLLARRIAVTDIRSDHKTAMGFKAAIDFKSGGTISTEGRMGADAKSITGDFKGVALDLSPLKPYVARFTTLQLAGGKASSEGRFAYQHEESGPRVRYDGALGITNLLLKEARTGERFLAWRSLSVSGMRFSLDPDRLDIARVRVLAPGAKIVVYRDRSVNLAKIMKPQAAGGNKPRTPAKPVTSRQPRAKRGSGGARFPVNIQQVRLEKGEVDFADLSLVLPFATRVWDVKGSTSGIASAPAGRTKLQFEGRVDDYGLAKASGSLQPLRPKSFTDITVVFRNVEMSRLSPYSATFAGRKIASGKLNLDLEYKIDKSQLAGQNKVMLEKFTLGERVEAPNALDLPLDLAIALLTDAQGKIDIAVPVSGNVDQPEFSYGKVIWNAFTTLIRRAVTAPFRALGGLFGGGEEPSVDAILFESGSAELAPPEQEKLKKVADALKQRPQLRLVVLGRFDEKLDAQALREEHVRQALAARLGIKAAAGEDAGPVGFDDAKTQRAMEALLTARSGPEAVVAFKTEYEKSTGHEAQRVNPALALIGRASPDTAFYQALFERLTELEPLAQGELTRLAESRAKVMLNALSALGIEPARLATGGPAAAERSDGKRVASALQLEALESGG